jgi:replication factor C subunit 1
LIAKSASALSYSEIAERKIMSKQAWSLLPTVATLSTVLPGQFMGGGLNDRVDFPKELGKMSTTNKNARIAGDQVFILLEL